MAIAWEVVGILVAVLLGSGLAMIGLTPPDFTWARRLIAVSALVLAVMTIYWLLFTTADTTHRVWVTVCVSSYLVILFPLGVFYVSRHQHIQKGSISKRQEVAPANTASPMLGPVDLHGEILELYFDKSDDIPSFPTRTIILVKAELVNHGPLEATISRTGLRVRIGDFDEVTELLRVIPDSWRIKYRNTSLLNIAYIEVPISPLLGHVPQEETYRTAIPRVGWMAFELYGRDNIEFPNAEFTLVLVDSLGGEHLICRPPQLYTKPGIFVKV